MRLCDRYPYDPDYRSSVCPFCGSDEHATWYSVQPWFSSDDSDVAWLTDCDKAIALCERLSSEEPLPGWWVVAYTECHSCGDLSSEVIHRPLALDRCQSI